MNRSIPLGIAGLSTFIHVCMIIFVSVTLVQIALIMAEPVGDDDDYDDRSIRLVGGFVVAVLVISLLLEIAALVVSIFLIIGIKRDRAHLMAPWVYLTAVYTILSFIGLVKGSTALDTAFVIKVIIIILNAAMWYPVFRYWRDFVTKRNVSALQNVAYTTPSNVYSPGPGSWQEGQVMANYQSGGYYPPYGGVQVQPSVHPQLATVNYPRQMATTTTTISAPEEEMQQLPMNK